MSTAPNGATGRQFERGALDTALALHARGHEVVIVVADPQVRSIEATADQIRAAVPDGIAVVPLPDPVVPPALGPMAREVRHSYDFHEWAKTRRFDVVFANDRTATTYFAQIGRLLGHSGVQCRYIIEVAGPEIWRRQEDRVGVRDLSLLVRFEVEQNAVEQADAVIVPSAAMGAWIAEHGYRVDPARISVLPPSLEVNVVVGPRRQAAPASELVFIGPATARGGFMLFTRMVVQLLAEDQPIEKVTFFVDRLEDFHHMVSAARKMLGPDLAERIELRRAPSTDEVLNYLAEGGRLAVVPNMGAAGDVLISAALLRELPILVGCRGSAPELVDPAVHDVLLLDENPNKAVKTLAAAIRSGVPVGVAAPALRDAHAARVALVEEQIVAARAEPKSRITLGDDPPLVTVCLMHFNRPQLIVQALDSVKRQTYPKLDVVLVDDGSSDPDVPPLLDSLEKEFAPRGWRVVRQENLYLGAARNTAARNAQGDFLFYLDDDNVAKPHAVETFVKGVLASDAQILTCFSEIFRGEDPPDESAPAERRIIQVGPALAYGLFRNSFGDGNAFIHRETFLSLGGNSELWGIGKDDQEFFARALLAGHKLWILPEALFWARQLATRLRDRHYDWYSGHARVLDIYLRDQPSYLRNLIALCQGLGTGSSGNTLVPGAIGINDRELQRIATALRKSVSWRITKPIHNNFYDVIGRSRRNMRLPLRPTVETNPWYTILRVLNSYSWELTAILRLPASTVHLVGRKVARLMDRRSKQHPQGEQDDDT